MNGLHFKKNQIKPFKKNGILFTLIEKKVQTFFSKDQNCVKNPISMIFLESIRDF